MDFEEISEKPFTYLMSRFKPCVNIIFPLLMIKLWKNGRWRTRNDHDLDIDEFSDEESIVGYEKEDDFLSIVNT